MLGTPYFPNLSGSILLLEDVNEAPYKIDRLLVQMHQAGVLDEIAGIAVGQLTGCEDKSGRPDALSAEEVIKEHAGRLGVPLVLGLPVGHQRDSWAAVFGARAMLNPTEAELTYTS